MKKMSTATIGQNTLLFTPCTTGRLVVRFCWAFFCAFLAFFNFFGFFNFILQCTVLNSKIDLSRFHIRKIPFFPVATKRLAKSNAESDYDGKEANGIFDTKSQPRHSGVRWLPQRACDGIKIFSWRSNLLLAHHSPKSLLLSGGFASTQSKTKY